MTFISCKVGKFCQLGYVVRGIGGGGRRVVGCILEDVYAEKLSGLEDKLAVNIVT